MQGENLQITLLSNNLTQEILIICILTILHRTIDTKSTKSEQLGPSLKLTNSLTHLMEAFLIKTIKERICSKLLSCKTDL